ncbi:MAG: hypothetical protein ABIQ30_08460 [Devosia sp.]
MAFEDDFETLLQLVEPKVAAMARKVTTTVQRIRPDFVPKVSLAWQTVNFHHPKAKFVNAVYLRTNTVYLVFQDGRLLDSKLLVDDGKVKRVRWIPFRPGDKIPTDEIAILIAEAVALRM